MAATPINRGGKPKRNRPPAQSIAEAENQVISDAVSLAHRQIQDGTASSQVIVHYIKLGSTRELLEQEKLRNELELAKAKIRQLEAGEGQGDLLAEALAAFRGYEPTKDLEEYDV